MDKRPLAVTINAVSVKERTEFCSTLLIKGEVNDFPYEATYDLREGNSCDGSVTVSGQKLSGAEAEPILIEIGTLLDESEDATLQAEMARICGESE